MSIEEFGNSLLAKQREYNEKMYEKRRREDKSDQKDAIKDALKMRLITGVLDTGLQIGNDIVRDRTSSYLNSSDILDKKAHMLKANSTINSLLAEQKKIDGYKGGIDAYFQSKAEEELKAEMDKTNMGLIAGNYSDRKFQEVQGIAAFNRSKELKKQFLASLNEAQRLAGTGETDISKFTEAINKRAPSTIKSFVANKVRGLFSGQDPARNAIEKLVDVSDFDQPVDTPSGKADILFAYDNLFNGDATASVSYANAVKAIEQTTGKKINSADFWGKPDQSFGETETITISTYNQFTGETEFKDVKARQLFLNDVPSGVYYDFANKPIKTDVADNSPINLQTNDPAVQATIKQTQADVIDPSMGVFSDFKNLEYLNKHIEGLSGTDGTGADILNTGGAWDKQNKIIVNNIFGKIHLTRQGMMKNYGLDRDEALAFSANLHVLNFRNQKSLDGFVFDKLDTWFRDDYIEQIDTNQDMLRSSMAGINQNGIFNSLGAIIVLNDEAVTQGNVEAFGLNARAIDDLYTILDSQVSADLQKMPFNSLAALNAIVAGKIKQYEKDHGLEGSRINRERLRKLSRSIANQVFFMERQRSDFNNLARNRRNIQNK